MRRQLLSVVIITKNEVGRLPACLDSIAFADEIIIVDSGSEDGTVALAKSRGCKVIHQDWLGFGPQKQFAVSEAGNDWVLCLDADERVSIDLRNSIELTLDSSHFNAYEMPRCNRFMGRWLKFGEGYPDYSLRLFHRRYAKWSDDTIHEKVMTSCEIGKLKGDLLHESHETLGQYLDKQNRYTSLQAKQLYESGKRSSLFKIILNPIFRFIKMYFFRLGFLDGIQGTIHILIGCFNTFMKYAKLREIGG